MQKNITHEVMMANVRNDLVDYINSKKIVIEITDSLLNEFQKEYEEKKKSNKFAKFSAATGALGFLFGPVAIPWMIITGGITLFSGMSALGYDFKKYSIASFRYKNQSHTLLIRNDFYEDLDYIQGFEEIRFVHKKRAGCPICKNALPKNKKICPFECVKCGTKIVYYYK